MQAIETERICSLEQLIGKLSAQILLLAGKQRRVGEAYASIGVNVGEEIREACRKYGTASGGEQELCLYDVFSENTKNMMNRERRGESLSKWAEMLAADLGSQVRACSLFVALCLASFLFTVEQF
jgi:hypothetical protein